MTEERKTVLFVSIGGSTAPIISSIRQIRPDEIFFVVSDGADGVPSSENSLPEIKAKSGTNAPQHIIRVTPDDLESIFAKTEVQLARMVASGAQVVVDYTGGTKTMTSGLVLAATGHKDVRLQFMAGKRTDLDKVEDGSETTQDMPLVLLGVAQSFRTADSFLEHRNYGAALGVLQNLRKDIQRLAKSRVKPKPPKKWNEKLDARIRWLTVLDLWDRFDHSTAYRTLEYGLDYGCSFALSLAQFANCMHEAPIAVARQDLAEDFSSSHRSNHRR